MKKSPRVIYRDGFALVKGSRLWAWYWRNYDRLHGIVKRKKHKKPVPPTPTPVVNPIKPIEMYDDINLSLIPVSAEAVAGYVDGRWPTYAQLIKKFPHAKYRLSIAVFAKDDAAALDVEPGDATIAEAAGWIKREKARGNPTPIIYTAVSWAEKLLTALDAAGLVYGKDYRYWSAHYNYKPHLCNKECGFGFTRVAHATQWTDKAGGKSLDESLCSADFFPKGSPV